MSPQVKKLGITTILMFVLGAFFAPVVYHIATNAMKTPQIALELKYVGNMVKANTVVQGEMLLELKNLRLTNIEEHQAIIDTMKKNINTVQSLAEDCDKAKNDIQRIDNEH